MEVWEACMYGIAISISALLVASLHHFYYYNANRFGMRTRLALSGLIYRKVRARLPREGQIGNPNKKIFFFGLSSRPKILKITEIQTNFFFFCIYFGFFVWIFIFFNLDFQDSSKKIKKSFYLDCRVFCLDFLS
jgi:hypothetical protein